MIDLIHAGNLGLVEAARRFNAERDATFVRFASWWVRQAMIHALADRASLHPMPPSVLATPSTDRVMPAVAVDDDVDSCLADAVGEFDDDDAEPDETFHDIQLRASGFPRSADRLRSHLN